MNAFIETISDAQVRSRFGNRVAKCLLRVTDRDSYRHRQAALTRTTEGAVADDLRRHVHVGIRQNDDVILGAALALCTLSVRTGPGVDMFCDRSRSDETDRANFGMIEQRIDHGFSAIDQIDYALAAIQSARAIRTHAAW